MKLRVLLIAVCLVLGGCVSPTAIKTLKDGISANKRHMTNTSLPQQAREIAQDNYDFMSQVLYNLDGTPVSADTAERMKAREAARAGGE